MTFSFELLRPLDRLAAGRHRDRLASAAVVGHTSALRIFRGMRWMLFVELIVGVLAAIAAVVLTARGYEVSAAVWLRTCGVLAITVTLYYFAVRAAEGYYWAYQRLRLFTIVFPIVTLVTASIPGLYPLWMTIEQVIFSLILIAVGDLLASAPLRIAFPRPGDDALRDTSDAPRDTSDATRDTSDALRVTSDAPKTGTDAQPSNTRHA
jgi:hypothetical protein